ncbi:MAG: acetolactate synthase [Planctomycetaceae bacterium]|nr:acetolactate synthase [Planctomycetaceae bacterium]
MSYGDDAVTSPETLRGRDWPCLRQFGVFLENRVGLLHELLRSLERHDLRVIALSIADSIDCAVVRVIVDDYERGKELLSLTNQTVFEADVIGVELPDSPQPWLDLCMALMEAEVNVHYTYPLLFRRRGRSAIALYVDDVDTGLRVLRQKGHRLVTENDLSEDDECL